MTLIERLRALADWFEAHPDAMIPYNLKEGSSFYIPINDKAALKHIGSFKKEWCGSDLHAVVTVGDLRLIYFINRNQVCTPRVVGKRQVPETIIEGTPTRIISAHEEDIIEWDCGPVLADESEVAPKVEV